MSVGIWISRTLRAAGWIFWDWMITQADPRPYRKSSLSKYLLPLIPAGLVVDQVLPGAERIAILTSPRQASAFCPSPTSRIRRGFWDFCAFPVAQASDLFGNPFMKVARIGCSEDLAPSRGQDFLYWSAPASSFCTGAGNDPSQNLSIWKSSKVEQLPSL